MSIRVAVLLPANVQSPVHDHIGFQASRFLFACNPLEASIWGSNDFSFLLMLAISILGDRGGEYCRHMAGVTGRLALPQKN